MFNQLLIYFVFLFFQKCYCGLIVDYGEEVYCKGGKIYNTTLTAYYPDSTGIDESGYEDVTGQPLRSLQTHLDGRSDFVTIAMDPALEIPYGTKVCIESLNRHYGMYINFEVRDTGSYLRGAGFSRVDICVRSEADSYDKNVNTQTEIVILPENSENSL